LEGALAVAAPRSMRTSLAWRVPRRALPVGADAAVAILMAEIEEASTAIRAACANGWPRHARRRRSRMDAMRCVGRWLPVSPNGRLDGYEWKLPLAEIGTSRR